MCFDHDSRPPALPADLELAPIAGGAKAEQLVLTAADGTELAAAFAPAAQSHGTAVVILPDVRGLYRFYVELAERFAQAGHDAVVIDYFGRTAGPGERDEDFDFWPHVSQITVPTVQQDIRAAVEFLQARVTPDRIATVGFCLGGSLSFLAGANDELSLDRVVGFYGGLTDRRGRGFPEPAKEAGRISVPVLGLFGGADEGIPQEDVDSFDAGLRVEHEIHVYPGAPHSFFDRKHDEFAEECDDAWRRTLRFLTAA